MSPLIGQGVSSTAFTQSPAARSHADRGAGNSGARDSFRALVDPARPSRPAGSKTASPAPESATGDGHVAPAETDAPLEDAIGSRDVDGGAAERPVAANAPAEPPDLLGKWAFGRSQMPAHEPEARSEKGEKGEKGDTAKSAGSNSPDNPSLTLMLHDLPRSVAAAAQATPHADTPHRSHVPAASTVRDPKDHGRSAATDVSGHDVAAVAADAPHGKATAQAGGLARNTSEASPGPKTTDDRKMAVFTAPPPVKPRDDSAGTVTASPLAPVLSGESVVAATAPMFAKATGKTTALRQTPVSQTVDAPQPTKKSAVDRPAIASTEALAPSGPAGVALESDDKSISQPVLARHAPVDRQSADASSTRSADDKPAVAARATVVAQQSFPAPASHPLGQASTAVVSAIAADDGWRQAASPFGLTSAQPSTVAVPAHTLSIDLHPADLGIVTANLRLVGEQLSIALKPSTHEAYRRLSSDSETIVKSLRGLGFDVDTVTVLQPAIAAHAAARADAQGSMAPATGQNQSSFQAGGSGGRGQASGDQQPGRNGGHDGQANSQRHAHRNEIVDDSLFI